MDRILNLVFGEQRHVSTCDHPVEIAQGLARRLIRGCERIIQNLPQMACSSPEVPTSECPGRTVVLTFRLVFIFSITATYVLLHNTGWQTQNLVPNARRRQLAR